MVRHRACRQMLEEVTRERDEALKRAEYYEQRWREQDAKLEHDLDSIQRAYEILAKADKDARAKAEAERDDAVWELAMAKEGLA